MIKQGIIKKMKSTYLNPIRYELPIGSEFICINELIDKKVRFIFNDTIICILCGSKTKKEESSVRSSGKRRTKSR